MVSLLSIVLLLHVLPYRLSSKYFQVALTDAKPSHLKAALTASNPAHLKYSENRKLISSILKIECSSQVYSFIQTRTRTDINIYRVVFTLFRPENDLVPDP